MQALMSSLRLPGQPQIASLVLEVEGAGWPSRSSKPLWGAGQRPRWVRLPCTSATIGQVRQVGATRLVWAWDCFSQARVPTNSQAEPTGRGPLHEVGGQDHAASAREIHLSP